MKCHLTFSQEVSQSILEVVWTNNFLQTRNEFGRFHVILGIKSVRVFSGPFILIFRLDMEKLEQKKLQIQKFVMQ